MQQRRAVKSRFYKKTKSLQALFVKHQRRCGKHGLTPVHLLTPIRMLTNCLGHLQDTSCSVSEFAEKAGTIIESRDIAADKIKALFYGKENLSAAAVMLSESDEYWLKTMLTLSLLEQKDRATYEECFDKLIPSDVNQKEKFLSYYMIIVSHIISHHIMYDILIPNCPEVSQPTAHRTNAWGTMFHASAVHQGGAARASSIAESKQQVSPPAHE